MRMLVGCDHGCSYFRPREQLTVVGGAEVGSNALGHLVATIRSDLGKTDPSNIRMLHRNLGPDQPDASRSHDSEADRLGRTLGRHLFLPWLSAQFTPDPRADQVSEAYGDVSKLPLRFFDTPSRLPTVMELSKDKSCEGRKVKMQFSIPHRHQILFLPSPLYFILCK